MNYFSILFLKMLGFLACSRGGLSETELQYLLSDNLTEPVSDDDVGGSKKNAEAISKEHCKRRRRRKTRVFPRLHTRGKRISF